jgi:tetratricopeptide (TPR) repeat protein
MKITRLAASLLGLGLAAHGQDVASLITQGDALDAKLQNRQALAVYQAAEKLDQGNVELLCRIARQHGLMMVDASSKAERQLRGEKALDYAKRALALDHRSATAHLSVAICSGRLAPLLDNKTKLAYSKLVKEHAEKALELNPDNDLTHHVLGAWHYEIAQLGAVTRTLAKLIYGAVPSASLEKAADHLEKAVKLNPHRMGNHVELGRAYAALGRKRDAQKSFNAALQMPNREKDDPSARARALQGLKELQ